ncbi:MAG: hypothetical protein C5B52_13250 [Bacteroidetes bacterium]|nr:MAG: hypothetical protein C5B52_13250 [Bacteroidota bacterium]
MKKIYLLLTVVLSILTVQLVHSQPVIDPNDPEVIFSSTYKPPVPANGAIAKWGHAKRLSWNSSAYKCYYFNGMNFRIKFPKSYQHLVNDGKKYPVYLFFPGLGEKGDSWDNEWSLLHGGDVHLNAVNAGTFDGFLIYVQTSTGYFSAWFSSITTLLDTMARANKVDLDKIILSGLSGGGQADWDFLQTPAYARYIAACMPISAAQIEDTPFYKSHITIPIWTTNGGLDSDPAPGTAAVCFQHYKDLGGDLTQTLYPNLGHGTWDTFWKEPNYWYWINSRHKANPLVYFQRNLLCPGDPVSVKLGLQAGFNAYAWQFRPDTLSAWTDISGQTTNNLTATTYGYYRARFRRTSTSAWSDWSPAPVQVGIKPPTVTPPIQINGIHSNVLPAPDGATTVPLMVPSTYVSYDWRKISDNSQVSTTNTYNAPIGQFKVMVTEQFGCSSNFSPAYTVIDANGANKPDKAGNVMALTKSNTSIEVDWSDNPNPIYNETAFEVYRSTTAGGPYTMIGSTPADSLTFIDQGLNVNTRYYYIVRAVNASGAAPVSTEVTAKTLSDNQPPTAPTNLVISWSTRSSITLDWDPSTDDVGVYKYDVYVNGVKQYTTDQTEFTVTNLNGLTNYTFFVKARDLAGNISPSSNQITGITKLRGIKFNYFEWANTITALPDFNTLTIKNSGTQANIDLSQAQKTTNYGFVFYGFLKVPVAGTYLFETNSDDGSKLYIGSGTYSNQSTALVNNDGSHGGQYRSGSITLQPGVYPLIATYFQGTGGSGMTVYWTCAAAGFPTRTKIPDSSFADNVTLTSNINAPSNLKASTVAYNKIGLTWEDNSNNESGFEIYRAQNIGDVFVTVGNAPANATSYVDTTCAASTRYYYKVKAVGSSGESALTQNYVEANWKFNGNVADSSGNVRNGTAVNTPTFDAADKKEGSSSIVLNGTNQSVTLPNTNNFLQEAYTERTVAFWMKSAISNSSNRMLFDIGGSDDGLAIRLSNSTLTAGIASNNTRVNFTANLTSSTVWNHIALVYFQNTLKLYINGVLANSNTALGFSSLTTTTNAASIGTTNGSNAFNTSTSPFSGRIDNFVVLNTALSQTAVNDLMNNSLVQSNATTAQLPPAPAAPDGLTATANSTSKITLNWADHATNETGYEVWRSTNNTNNFRLIANVLDTNGSIATYQDTGLYANVTYYYEVRAYGVGGFSAYTNIANASTPNNKPKLTGIGSFAMKYGTQKVINIVATDIDGEVLNLSVVNLPAFGVFANTGNGTGTITLSPSQAQQGVFNIKVRVNDQHGGADSLVFTATVNSNNPPSLQQLTGINVTEGTSSNVQIVATDPDGTNTLQWSTTGFPAFASLVANSNGISFILLNPDYASEGTYPVSVTVNDGAGGSSTSAFNIVVARGNPNSQILVDIADASTSAPSPAPWNKITGATTNNLLDNNGQATGINLVFNSSWQTYTAGAQTGNNSGVYPDLVMKDYFWFGAYGVTNTVNITVSGLDPSYKYNFTFLGNSSYTALGDNGSTIYAINGISKTLNVQNNTQNTVTISNIAPDGTGTITINLSKAAGSAAGYLNAFVIEKLYDDGTTPIMPGNVAASNMPDGKVLLTWKDIAYNETRYDIYRATNQAGPYSLLSPSANQNDTTYIDANALALTTYYYKLVAVNDNGLSDFTDPVSITTLNKTPVLTPISNVMVKTFNQGVTNITSTDDPGDILTTTVKNLPAFATFQNTGNGTATITYNPATNDIGVYSNVIVTVSDNHGASVSDTITVTVTDKDVRTWYVNYGGEQSPPAPAPWTNVNSFPWPNLPINNMNDETNTPTSVNITMVDSWQGNVYSGMVTGSNNGIYPDIVMAHGFYESSTNAKTIRFSGLNPQKKYNIGFFGSNDIGVQSAATYTSGAKSVTMDGTFNTNKNAQLNGLVPDGTGTINVTMTKPSSASYAVLNALVLEEYDPSLGLVRPGNLFAEVVNKNSIKLTWSDRSDNETGFEIRRDVSPNGSFATVAGSVGANTNTFTDVNLISNTKYYYKVRALGSTNSDYSNTASTTTPLVIDYVNFNVTVPPPGNPWNSFNANPVVGAGINPLMNDLGFSSGIGIVVSMEFNGENYTGVTTGNNSGIFPDNVMHANFWIDPHQLAQFKLTNLNLNKKYRIGFFGSSTWSGSDFTTAYSVGGKTTYLNSYYNQSKAMYIDGLVPDQNGELLLNVTTAGNATFSFTSAVVIQMYDDTTTGSGGIQGRTSGQPEPVQVGNGRSVGTPNAFNGKLRAYPNPFVSQVFVDFSTEQAGNVAIQLTDVSGRLMYQNNAGHLDKGSYNLRLDLGGTGLAPGIYFMRVTRDGVVEKSIKLIKTKN